MAVLLAGPRDGWGAQQGQRPANQVQNGTFEQVGDDGLARHWTVQGRCLGAVLEPGGGPGGDNCQRLECEGNVPFHTSFEGCIEKYFDNRNGTLYACTVCWYQSPDGKDPYKPLSVVDRYGYWVKPEVTIAGMKVLNDQEDWHCRVFVQDMSRHGHGKWNSDEELRWDRVTTGNRLELGLPDVKPGVYEISVQLTKGRDFGIVQFYLDGKKIGEPIDLYKRTYRQQVRHVLGVSQPDR